MSKARPTVTATHQAKLDLEAVCSTVEGRRVLWRIVTLTNVWGRNPSINSPTLLPYYEGQRAVGVALLEDIEALDPNLVPLMMQERLNDEMERTLNQKVTNGNGDGTDD